MLSSSASLAPGIYVEVVTSLPHPLSCRSTSASELASLSVRRETPADMLEFSRFRRPIGSEPISRMTGGFGPVHFFKAQGQQISGAAASRIGSNQQLSSVRMLTLKIQTSLQNGLQWAVFENNGPALWSQVVSTVEGFMQNLFQQGSFQGSSPSQAYFVQCGPATMTQNDIDNGRLIAIVGFAPVYPAEFVVLHIGIQTRHK